MKQVLLCCKDRSHIRIIMLEEVEEVKELNQLKVRK